MYVWGRASGGTKEAPWCHKMLVHMCPTCKMLVHVCASQCLLA